MCFDKERRTTSLSRPLPRVAADIAYYVYLAPRPVAVPCPFCRGDCHRPFQSARHACYLSRLAPRDVAVPCPFCHGDCHRASAIAEHSDEHGRYGSSMLRGACIGRDRISLCNNSSAVSGMSEVTDKERRTTSLSRPQGVLGELVGAARLGGGKGERTGADEGTYCSS